ncbi:MAG: serine hydrolase domain-containing protein [Candidatus Cybelea sp.]
MYRPIPLAAALSVSLLIFCAPIAAAPSPASVDAATAHLDGDIAAALRRYNIPGATVAVVDGSQVIYARAFGFSDLGKYVPASVDTHYEIGSITKQFTAAAIVQLSQAGKLDLDAEVATYVPGVPHANEITLRQLLAQTSGLPEYLEGPDIDQAAKRAATFGQIMQRIAGKPLAFAPGSRWQYSNTNYLILGQIIETVSGERYEDYIARHLLDPLGMSATFIISDEPHVPQMAVGYKRVNGNFQPALGTIGQSFASSAGDLVSTVEDLEKWDGALRAGRVVSAAGYALMTTPPITTNGENTGYGFGLFIDSVDGQPRIGHTGGDSGFTAADEYYPKQDLRVIALTNDGDDNGHPEAGEILTNVVFEGLYPEIAAAALRPSPGEDPRVTARVTTFFEQMQSGHEDYASLAPRLADKFRTRLASSLALEFAPYGTPTAVVFRGERVESGQHWFDYVIHFGPGVSLKFGISYNDANQIAGLSFG